MEESHGNRRTPKLLMDLNMISSLVCFSFLGTLSRLVLEALTFYPGAPATISVLWANFTGSLVLGFLSEMSALFRSDTGQAIVSRSDESELVAGDELHCLPGGSRIYGRNGLLIYMMG